MPHSAPRRLAFVPTASRVGGGGHAATDDADELRRQRALRADTSRARAENLACAVGASLFELHLDDIADAAEAVAREGGGDGSDVELAAAEVAAEALDRALDGTVAVLVGGGNTFYLASTLRRAGLGAAKSGHAEEPRLHRAIGGRDRRGRVDRDRALE